MLKLLEFKYVNKLLKMLRKINLIIKYISEGRRIKSNKYVTLIEEKELLLFWIRQDLDLISKLC